MKKTHGPGGTKGNDRRDVKWFSRYSANTSNTRLDTNCTMTRLWNNDSLCNLFYNTKFNVKTYAWHRQHSSIEHYAYKVTRTSIVCRCVPNAILNFNFELNFMYLPTCYVHKSSNTDTVKENTNAYRKCARTKSTFQLPQVVNQAASPDEPANIREQPLR